MSYFLTVCFNPTIQHTLSFNELNINEVNRANKQFISASGKGINVTRVLSQLGANVIHLTQDCPEQTTFRELYEHDHLKVISVPTSCPPRTCVSLITPNGVTEIVEEGQSVSTQTVDAARETFAKLAENAHTIIISGSTAPGFPRTIFAEFLDVINKQTIILDIRGEQLKSALEMCKKRYEHFRKYGTMIFVKPNYDEFWNTFLLEQSIQKESVSGIIATKEKMKELKKEFSVELIITRGIKPILYTTETNGVQEIPVELASSAINTVGCGDSFTAGFAFSLYEKHSVYDSILKGAECGKLNATFIQPGVIKNTE